MKISNFYFYWGCIRCAFITTAIVIMLSCAIKGNTWSLEIEYIGPGSEYQRLEREYNDLENERSKERVLEGFGSDRDYERANDWDRDHRA